MTPVPTKEDSKSENVNLTENIACPTANENGHRLLKNLSLTFLSFFITMLFATAVVYAVVSNTRKTDLPQTQTDPPSTIESLFIGNLPITDTDYIQTEKSDVPTDKASDLANDTTDDMPPTDAPESYIPTDADFPTDGTSEPNEPPKKQNVILSVNNILQKPELPNGCEVVSLSIVLSHYGFPIFPLDLYNNYMPKAPYKNGNPRYYYIGDATGVGLGCYAPCVVTTGNDYLAEQGSELKAYDVSGHPFEHYESYIERGIPVIIWGTVEMNANDKLCWEGILGGQYVNWHAYSHCLVLIGYTESTYVFCDPLVGIVEYGKQAVSDSFNIMHNQACIIE